MNFLLNNGSKIDDTEYSNQSTPLYLASLMDDEKVVKFLVQKGADINATSLGSCTALYEAAQNGHSACVGVLLEFGADKTIKSLSDDNENQYRIPLEIALKNEHFESAAFLDGTNVYSGDNGDGDLLIGDISSGDEEEEEEEVEMGEEDKEQNGEGEAISLSPEEIEQFLKNVKFLNFVEVLQ